MELNVHKEVAAMQRLGAKQLRGRYAEVFGEATTANNKTWLIRRIAWRLQALAEGDLTRTPWPRKRAEELGNDADLRMNLASAQGQPDGIPGDGGARRRSAVPGRAAASRRLDPWSASTGARRCRCACRGRRL